MKGEAEKLERLADAQTCRMLPVPCLLALRTAAALVDPYLPLGSHHPTRVLVLAHRGVATAMPLGCEIRALCLRVAARWEEPGGRRAARLGFEGVTSE